MSYWDTCICGNEAPDDYEFPTCCSGFECGCMGLPIEPYICSEECWKKLHEEDYNGKKNV